MLPSMNSTLVKPVLSSIRCFKVYMADVCAVIYRDMKVKSHGSKQSLRFAFGADQLRNEA